MQVAGIPNVRFSRQAMHLRWKTSLDEAVRIGSNHMLLSVLSRCGATYGCDELRILGDQPTAAQLKGVLFEHRRHYLEGLDFWRRLEYREVSQHLDWLTSIGYIPHPEQLDAYALWQIAEYAAAQWGNGDTVGYIARQLTTNNRIPIISHQDAQLIRKQLLPADQDGWHRPQDGNQSRVLEIYLGRQHHWRRLLIVGHDRQVWYLRTDNDSSLEPAYPIGRLARVRQETSLLAMIGEKTPRLWSRNRAMTTEAFTRHASWPYDMGGGMRRWYPRQLNVCLRLGPLAESGPQLLPRMPEDGADGCRHNPLSMSRLVQQLDYSNPDNLQARAKLAGISEAMPLPRILQHLTKGMQEYAPERAMFTDLLHTASVQEGLVDPRVDHLESMWCRRLPGGLLHPGMPLVANRLGGKIQPLEAYRPLSPYAAESHRARLHGR